MVRPPRAPTTVIGVVGGIASGKTLASRALAGPEGRVVDADRLAHEVLARPEMAERVRERFGPAALDATGRPDRAALGRIVFGDPAARAELESWIHPAVRAMMLAEIEAARAEGVPRVVLDVPLLLENDAEHGLARLVDVLVFVDAPTEERERRARAARGWAPGELARREAVQLSLDEKRRRADFVLANDAGTEELERRARSALERIEELASSRPRPSSESR